MKNWSTAVLFAVTFFAISDAHAYVVCQTKVKEIYPNKTTGIVYFKFEDGTAIQATDNDTGLERNFAVALAALMADKEVRISLNDGEQCGSNRYGNWSYITAFSS